MNWPNVGKIVSSVAHTVNNDVVKPIQRDIINPLAATQNISKPVIQQRPTLSFLQNLQPGTPANQGPTPPYGWVPGTDIAGPRYQPVNFKKGVDYYAGSLGDFTQSFNARPPVPVFHPPAGWTYGPIGGKNTDGQPLKGWRDEGGVPVHGLPQPPPPVDSPTIVDPFALKNSRHISAQPSYLNPAKLQAFQNRRLSI